MADKIVRCPYCVVGDGFRPMLQRPSWFVCEQCGHVVILDDPGFKCSCRQCTEINRAALDVREEHIPRMLREANEPLFPSEIGFA